LSRVFLRQRIPRNQAPAVVKIPDQISIVIIAMLQHLAIQYVPRLLRMTCIRIDGSLRSPLRPDANTKRPGDEGVSHGGAGDVRADL
jgi:hypothetical protein